MHLEKQTPLQNRWLYVAVFASGMTTLAVELTASRLLGSIFGTSNLVWANIIGLMLLYLTAGYFIGGSLADRSPRPVTLYRLIAWGAFFSGLVPMLARPVLSLTGQAVVGFQAGVALGSFVAVLVLFAVPIILLGCVSPFAIRLAVQDIAQSGKVAGRMYALSTMGSIFGTFLPVLILFDAIGTAYTFIGFAVLLLSVALIGLALHQRRAMLQLAWMPVLLLILAQFVFSSPLRAAPANTRLLYEKDSAYNYIQVVETLAPLGRLPTGTRLLLLNEGQGIHSVWSPNLTYFGGTWDMFLAAPFFNAPPFAPDRVRSLNVVGLAAGTIPTQFTAVFGNTLQVDGIEIDPAIVEAGRRYFGMTQPNLNVIVEDGRLAMRQSTRQYDVIALDAYRVPYVPWNLTTLEFFREVRARLTGMGVVVINVGRTVNYSTNSQDRRLVEAMTATMLKVFPSVHTIDVPNSFNTILVATVEPTRPENLRANLATLESSASPLLRTALQTAADNLKPTVTSELVFTDDRAPVESIVNAMVIEFLTGGGTAQFQRGTP